MTASNTYTRCGTMEGAGLRLVLPWVQEPGPIGMIKSSWHCYSPHLTRQCAMPPPESKIQIDNVRHCRGARHSWNTDYVWLDQRTVLMLSASFTWHCTTRSYHGENCHTAPSTLFKLYYCKLKTSPFEFVQNLTASPAVNYKMYCPTKYKL